MINPIRQRFSQRLHEPLLTTPENQDNTLMAITRDILCQFGPRVASNLLSTVGNAYLFSSLSSFSPQKNFSAATALIAGVRFVLLVIPSGFFYVVPVLFGSSGKGPIVMTNALGVAISLGLVGTVFSLCISDFFRSIGIDPTVCDIIQEYFYMFAPAFPIQLMTTVFNQIAPKVGAKHLLYIDSVLNALFLFVFSSFFLKLYPLTFLSKTKIVAISSLASVISRFLWYSASYHLKGDIFENLNSVRTAHHRDDLFSMLNDGGIVCLQLGAELVGSFALSILVPLMLGDQKVNLSILNVMNQFFIFSVVIPVALAVTAMIKISELKKDEKTDLIDRYVNVFLGLAALYNIVVCGIVMSIPKTLASFFMNPGDNEHTGLSGSFRAMFAMTCVGIFFDSFKTIINMSYRGLGFNRLAMEISFTGVWLIGLPLAVLLSQCMGMAGLLLGFNMGNVFMGMCALSYWFKKENIEEQSSLWRDVKNGFFCVKRNQDEVIPRPSNQSRLSFDA